MFIHFTYVKLPFKYLFSAHPSYIPMEGAECI